jgi:hypothetical protein
MHENAEEKKENKQTINQSIKCLIDLLFLVLMFLNNSNSTYLLCIMLTVSIKLWL